MTTVLNLIPEKEDEAGSVFLGIVMVLIFPAVLRRVWSRKWRRRSTVSTLEEQQQWKCTDSCRSFEKQYYVGAWEKETERRSGCICQRAAFRGSRFGVTLSRKHGEAKEIRIEAPMRQTSIAKNRKTAKCSMKNKLTEIKSVLSGLRNRSGAYGRRFRNRPMREKAAFSGNRKRSSGCCTSCWRQSAVCCCRRELKRPVRRQNSRRRRLRVRRGCGTFGAGGRWNSAFVTHFSQMDGVGAVRRGDAGIHRKKIVKKMSQRGATTEENKKGERPEAVHPRRRMRQLSMKRHRTEPRHRMWFRGVPGVRRARYREGRNQ